MVKKNKMIFICFAMILLVICIYLYFVKDQNDDLPKEIVDVEWYQDNHPSDVAILRFSSDHTISYYEVGSGNGYEGDFDLCNEYTYNSTTKEITLNCQEHTMKRVHYENGNRLTLMVDGKEIVYYNLKELIN